jgi:hypothetical protein
MTVRQLIQNNSGGARTIATDALMNWSGDGHNHWHTQDMMFYQIWPSNGGEVRRDEKVGFCFLDTTRVNLSLPGAPQSSYYRGQWCGTQSSLTVRVGISIGWGDSYPANFALQWLDVTGFPPGSYVIRAKVDPHNWFIEKSEQNNCTWTRIVLPSSGTKVQVTSAGYQCVQVPVRDFPGATDYNPPETLWLDKGTHTGYRFSASGAIQAQKIMTIGSPTTAVTLRLSAVPGRSGQWFYVDSGPWNDYWLKKSSRVKLAP